MTDNTHPGLPNGASDGGIGPAGSVAGQDDPDHLQRLLQTLRGPAQPQELAGLTAMSAGMQSVVQQAMHAMASDIENTTAGVDTDAGSGVSTHPKERKHMLAKLITLKAAGIIGAGVLTMGTAAAATGGWSGPRPPEHSNASDTAQEAVAAMTADSSDDADVPEETTTDSDATDSVPDGTSTSTAPTSPVVDPAAEGDSITPCPEEAPVNHGEFVSSVAKNRANDDDEVRNRGAVVSDAARSDCGKPGQDDTDTDSATTTATQPTEEESLQVTDTSRGNGSAEDGNPSGNPGNGKSVTDNGKKPNK